jgi:hypothetical protein
MTVVAGVSPAKPPCSGNRVAAKSKSKQPTRLPLEEASPAKVGRFLLSDYWRFAPPANFRDHVERTAFLSVLTIRPTIDQHCAPTRHELMTALTEAGCDEIDEVRAAFLENDDKVSIIPKNK